MCKPGTEMCTIVKNYLTCNPDEEVDHGVCMLFFHRLWEHGFCAWHGLATPKHLEPQTFIINRFLLFAEAKKDFWKEESSQIYYTGLMATRLKNKIKIQQLNLEEWIKLTVEAGPVAVRNLLTSCPAAPLSRDKPLFTPLVPSPPGPTSLSDSGCQTKTGEEDRLKPSLHDYSWGSWMFHLCVGPGTHQLVFDPL